MPFRYRLEIQNLEAALPFPPQSLLPSCLEQCTLWAVNCASKESQPAPDFLAPPDPTRLSPQARGSSPALGLPSSQV